MKPIQWAIGFSALATTLTVITELGMGEIAATLSLVILTSAILVNGDKMLSNLNDLVGG